MKTFVKTGLILCILFGAIYFSANAILKKLAVKTLAELQPRLEQKGILVDSFDYAGIRLTGYNRCTVSDFEVTFHLNRQMFGKQSFKTNFKAEKIQLRFADLHQPSFFFNIKDFSLFTTTDDAQTNKPYGKLENGFINIRLPVYIKSPENSAREILAQLKTLFHENSTPIDLDLQADAWLGIDDKKVKVGLFTIRENGRTQLRLDDDDIYNSSKQFDLDLAEKEAEIIANYPNKVPTMIKITRDAKRYSKEEAARQDGFPEDAFRHIYWSYHLTRTLGPELAKKITDAHETAPGNTQAEHEMDYHNNAVGQQYAKENLSYDDLKDRALHRPEIIRSPESVAQLTR